MPDKSWKELTEVDRVIRLGCPVGMEEGTKLIVRLICGFELFNTRPYHNYETWSNGYAVIGRIDGAAMDRDGVADALSAQISLGEDDPYCRFSAEDLDAAVDGFFALRDRLREAQAKGEES